MFKALTVTFKGAFLWESPRSLGPWCIKGTEETLLRVDSSVPLMCHDPSDLSNDIKKRISI